MMAGEGNGGAGAAAVVGGAGTGAGGSGGAAAGSGSGGGAAQGGGAPASGAALGGSAGAGAVVTDWTTGFSEDHKGFVGNKGWKNAGDAIDSYRNLEKLLGAPKEQMIQLPKEADSADWEGIYTRLGRPATPDGYKLQTPKEGGNAEFTKWASEQFHKAGLSEKQGNAIVNAWNERFAQMTEAGKKTNAAKVQGEIDGLKKEWGKAHEQNTNIAKRAAREFGIKPEAVDALQRAVGFSETMKLFHKIGTKIGEGNFISGSQAPGDRVFAPAEAKAEIARLKADPAWSKRFIAGGAAERTQMERLHQMAYTESA